MPKLIATPSKQMLPEGIYEGDLVDVEVRKNANGDFLIWKWLVRPHDKEPIILSGVSSTSVGPKSKARKIVEALLCRRLQDFEEIDTADYVGLNASLVVTEVERDGSLYSNVSAVTRAAKPKAKEEKASKKPDGKDF